MYMRASIICTSAQSGANSNTCLIHARPFSTCPASSDCRMCCSAAAAFLAISI
jgi:hypothetical protein